MAKGIQAIALIAPVVTTNTIFSMRRFDKGLDNIDEHPVYGAMNFDIAAGQVLKGTRAALSASPALEQEIGYALNGAAESAKFMRGVAKVVNFTADNINPIICLTGGLKVLGSDDKLDTAARESSSLLTMFAFEGAAKSILGMPTIKHVNGKTVKIAKEALYKKSPFITKQIEAFEDYCSTKKLFNKLPLTGLPGMLKGIAFVLASIYGYKLGAKIASRIIDGKPQKEQSQTQQLQTAYVLQAI